MAYELQAPVLVTPAEPLTVTLDHGDALSVGLSLQTQIARGDIPAHAAAPYKRIAEQLVAAARAAAGTVGR